jgi:hypothetical protein
MTTNSTASAARPQRGAGVFALSGVTTQARRLPNRVVLHAVGGWGKTSFAAQIPGAIFLMVGQETGLWTLMEAGQVPEKVPHFPQPAGTIQDLHAAIRALLTEDHSYKALVIDAITGVETLLHELVCKSKFGGDWDSFNQFGSEQAFKQVGAAWEDILRQLDILREKGMGIFLISHSRVVNFKNPEGPDYERWQSLTKYSWERVFQWSDITLFGSFEQTIAKRDKRKSDAETKGKVTGGEVRVLHTERRGAFDAKNRHNLPPEIECGNTAQEAWANFVAALKAGKEK